MTRTDPRRITIVFVVLVMAVSCWAADDPGEAAQTATGEKYLTVREKGEVAPDPAELLSGPRSALSGKVLEVAGKITGRSSVPARDDISVSFMLHVDQQTLFVDANRDSAPIRVGNTVQALIELPADGNPLDHFELRAIAYVGDLPAEVRLQAAKKSDTEAADEGAPAETRGEEKSPGSEKSAGDQAAQTASETSDDTASESTASADKAPRPGTQYPDFEQMWPNQEDVQAWMDWIREENSKLNKMTRRVIAESVLHYADQFEVDHRLVFAMIDAESNFDPNCRSRSGALGLTQLMPGTAEKLGVSDPLDIQQNIKGGVQYLAEQLKIYSDKSPYQQCVLGLAAYNAGPNAVKRAGGIPNNGETPQYCQKVAELFYKLWKNDMP